MKARSARAARTRLKHEFHFAKQAVQEQCEVETETTIDIVEVDSAGKVSLTHLVIRRLNVVRPICDALLGEKHSTRHRMAAGVVVMAVGVTIAKTAGHLPNMLMAVIGDGIGYGLHGLGLVPFIDHLAEKFKKSQK